MSVRLLSPAKVNLYLHVLNKRKDRYHEIVTVFERIDLCDDIRFTKIKGDRIVIVCDDPEVPTGRKNLVYQVAERLKKDFSISTGVKIIIKKRIPVAAGLAGGSSNAASAITGLNRLWRLGLSQKGKLKYANSIGSDVAFFLSDCSWAVGRGRGEKVRKLKISRKIWHVLVVPRLRLYASEIYGGLDRKKGGGKARKGPKRGSGGGRMKSLTKKRVDANILIQNIRNNSIRHIGENLSNDLEPVVLRFAPQLERLEEKLKSLDTQGVMVSGSGPAVFGLTENRKQANRLQSLLSKRYARVFAVKTL